jgi:hypothetical protein
VRPGKIRFLWVLVYEGKDYDIGRFEVHDGTNDVLFDEEGNYNIVCLKGNFCALAVMDLIVGQMGRGSSPVLGPRRLEGMLMYWVFLEDRRSCPAMQVSSRRYGGPDE